MATILQGLLPVFFLILCGYTARRTHWLAPAFWPELEKLAYYVLLPVLLFRSASSAPQGSFHEVLPLALIVWLVFSLMCGIAWVIKTSVRLKAAEYTALFQGIIQTNAAYIGLPTALALFGKEGFSLYALMLTLVFPAANFLALSVLVAHDPHAKDYRLWQKVIKHPLILSSVAGLSVYGTGVELPGVAQNIIQMIATAALPVGLFIVGGALDIKATHGHRRMMAVTSCLKLLVLPLLVAVGCVAADIGGQRAEVVMLYAALPTSAASYLMARKHSSNAPLTAGNIVMQTVLAVLTLPLVLLLARFYFS